jgi:hypothetical protein
MSEMVEGAAQIRTSLTREKKSDPDNLAFHPRTSPQRSPDLRFTPNQLQSRAVTQ